MSHIAIIPARAGSKSIPNKNLQLIGTRNLVQRAVDGALEAGFFGRIVISTDIETIIKDYNEDPLVRVIQRPESLASDEAEMRHVVKHVIKTLELFPTDVFWLLQPTTPFRKKTHFNEVRKFIEKTRANSVISFVNVGPYHPERMYTIKNLKAFPYKGNTNFRNKQTLRDVYIRNGAFYCSYVQEFLRQADRTDAFFVHPCFAYEMQPDDSINVDSYRELQLARLIDKEAQCSNTTTH